MRTIRLAETIEHPLYKGALEYSPDAIQAAVKGLSGDAASVLLPKSGPVITIGVPQCWNLVDLAKESAEPIPADMKLMLRDSDLFLVALACSFRPEKGSVIQWARFSVSMQPTSGFEKPIALDLYPREIFDEVKRNVAVTVSPSLKFAEAEISLGQALVKLDYRRLEPKIIGYGVLEANPSWDFQQAGDEPLRGSKQCCLIVKKPRLSQAVRISMDIIADVVTRHGLFSARTSEEARVAMVTIVCQG